MSGRETLRPQFRLIAAADKAPGVDCTVVLEGAPQAGDRRPGVPVLERKGNATYLLVSRWSSPPGNEGHRAWGADVGALILNAQVGPLVRIDLTHLSEAALQAAIEGMLEQLDVGVPAPDILLTVTDIAAAASLLDRAQTIHRAVALTKRIVNARGNQCPPPHLAAIGESVAADHGLGYRLLAEEGLRERGMNGMLAIGSGSAQPTLLAELWYQPGTRTPFEPATGAIALVGKGVTFDSGGLSLKSPAAQVGMHTDKAGAATVLGAMTALHDLHCPVPVHAVLPLAENLPGPEAVKPGDVVTTRNGIAVEIVDTDFEGRVMLADALAWAAERKPRAMIDVATLTYQAIVALGPSIGAVIARDEGLRSRILAASERAGEPFWALPWAPRYGSQVLSNAPAAALKNHPGTDTGRALTAALFLGAFVPEHIPWAHLDVAGPTVTGSGASVTATGFGVRTLLEMLTA